MLLSPKPQSGWIWHSAITFLLFMSVAHIATARCQFVATQDRDLGSDCVIADLPRWIAIPDDEWRRLAETSADRSEILSLLGTPTKKEEIHRGGERWEWEWITPFGRMIGGLFLDESGHATTIVDNRGNRFFYDRHGDFESVRILWGASQSGWPVWIDPAVWSSCLRCCGMLPEEVIKILGVPSRNLLVDPIRRAPRMEFAGLSAQFGEPDRIGGLAGRMAFELPVYSRRQITISLDFGHVDFPELRVGLEGGLGTAIVERPIGDWPISDLSYLVHWVDNPALLTANVVANPFNQISLYVAAELREPSRMRDRITLDELTNVFGLPRSVRFTGDSYPPRDPKVPAGALHALGLPKSLPVAELHYDLGEERTLKVFATVDEGDHGLNPESWKSDRMRRYVVVGVAREDGFGSAIREWRIAMSSTNLTAGGSPAWTEGHRWQKWLMRGVPKSWVEAVLGVPTSSITQRLERADGMVVFDKNGDPREYLTAYYGPWQSAGEPHSRWSRGECVYLRNPFSGEWILWNLTEPRRLPE